MSCNGWTNHATWLVNVWTDGDDELVRISKPNNGALNDRAQALKEYVEETYINLDRAFMPNGLMADLLSSVLCTVDWYELVRHYEDCEVEEDDDE